MKKIIVLFLLSLYLFSATDINELLKINIVTEHYKETKKQDNSVTFIQFLVMHYLTDDMNNKDNDRDKQLPFKSNKSIITFGSSIFFNNKVVTLSFNSFTEKENEFVKQSDCFIINNYAASIWHPPQLS